MMSDERRPQAYSLADELRDAGLVDLAPQPQLTVPRATPEGVLAAAGAMFDPRSRGEALLAHASQKPAERAVAEGPKVTRAEKVAKLAKTLEDQYGDRLDAVPSMAWFEGLSEAKAELVLDALAALEREAEEAIGFVEWEYAHPELDLDEEDEVHDEGGFAWTGDDDEDEES